MSRRARERGDKRERWEFQPQWQQERDEDLEGREIPDPDEDELPPSNTFH
jgi:hypothetical protein